MKKFVLYFVLLSNVLFAKNIKEDFINLSNWEELNFEKIDRHSDYSIENEVLIAKSDNSASGIKYRETFNPYETPIMNWKWMIENTYLNGDAKSKDGDDFPIRIYIIFKYDPTEASFSQRTKYKLAKKIYGEYPPHSALNYIWDNSNEIGEVITNPFTSSSKEIVLQVGDANAKTWIEEEVNVLEDYILAFGENPPNEASIAIMNDSDNTGESSTSYLDYIYISSKE